MATVLIVSAADDWSAAQVGQQLTARGIDFSWLDPADFPQRATLSARLDRGWRGTVRGPTWTQRWQDLAAVYYRRPKDFQMPEGMSEPERAFARAQARIGLGGVLTSLPVRWINHPAALADHEYKPTQLRLAESVGLPVPETLLTNDPDTVRQFADEIGEIIVKPLAHPVVPEAGSHTVAWTRRLTPADLDDLDGVRLTAHLFQQWLPKAYELRLTVVGQRFFAVAIHAHSDAARTDWRSDYEALTYRVVDCPNGIAALVLEYMREAHLSYAAFDFVITEGDEDIYFLECNGAGQWGWLAEECGLPIAAAIANELIGANS